MATELMTLLGLTTFPTYQDVLQNFYDHYAAMEGLEASAYPQEAVGPIQDFIYNGVCNNDEGLLPIFGATYVAFSSSPGYLAFMEEAAESFETLVDEDGEADGWMIVKAIKDIICFKSDKGYLVRHLHSSFDLITFMLSEALELSPEEYITTEFVLNNLQSAMLKKKADA